MNNLFNIIIKHKGLTTGLEIKCSPSDSIIPGELFTERFNIVESQDLDSFINTNDSDEVDAIFLHDISEYNYIQYQSIIQKCKKILSAHGIIALIRAPKRLLFSEFTDKDLVITYVDDLDIYIFQKNIIPKYTPMKTVHSCNWTEDMDYDKYVVVCIAKGEYKTLLDWVDYHIRLGFDKIIIYDNNDIGGETYNELLSEYIENNQVSIVDIRGIFGQQNNVYNEVYGFGNYKWLAVFDCDEFLQFKAHCPHTNVKSFIDASPAHAYMIPWECRANRPANESTPIYEWDKPLPKNTRRDSSVDPLNIWMKSIYKHGFKHILFEHWIINIGDLSSDFYISDENHIRVENQEEFIRRHNMLDLEVPQCVFAHYLLKDIDEFFYHKYLRGHAGVNDSAGVDGYCQMFWNQNLNYYAEIAQTLTQDEQRYLLKRGFRVNFTFRPTVVMVIDVINEDVEYYNRLKNIIDPLIEKCDIIYTTSTTPSLYGTKTLESVNSGYFPLYKRTYWYNWGLDLPKSIIHQSDMENHFIQKPLVFHIGYPTNEDSQEYLTKLQNTILNEQNFINMCRDICFFNQDKSVIYTAENLISYNIYDAGWSDAINTICAEYNITPQHVRISGNTFITNLLTYMNITKFIMDYANSPDIQNETLIRDASDGYSTLYDMACMMYPNFATDGIFKLK